MLPDASQRAHATAGRGGFTLIDTLVTVALISIMTAVGAPRVRSVIQHQQVDRTAQIIASDVRAAFTSSARGRVPVRLTFLAIAPRYTVTNRVTGDTITRRDFSTGDLKVSALSFTAASFDVFPSGIATTVDTIVVGNPALYTRLVTVSRVGSVRVR